MKAKKILSVDNHIIRYFYSGTIMKWRHQWRRNKLKALSMTKIEHELQNNELVKRLLESIGERREKPFITHLEIYEKMTCPA